MDFIDIDDIEWDFNVRTDIGDLSELMESIKHRGLLEPIGVCKKGNKYKGHFGFRRWNSLKKLGWTKLKVGDEVKILPEEKTKEEAEIDNLLENIQRKDLSPIEFGKICYNYSKKGYRIEEIATLFSVANTRVETAIRLFTNLPKEYHNIVGYSKQNQSPSKEGKISSTTAEKIITMRTSQPNINTLLDYAEKNDLSNPDIEVISNIIHSGSTAKEALEFKDEFMVKTVSFAVSKKEFEELEKRKYDYWNSFSNYVRAIIIGKMPPQPALIWTVKRKSSSFGV